MTDVRPRTVASDEAPAEERLARGLRGRERNER